MRKGKAVELSDEILMGYADGELSSAERSRVEAILARSASGRARLELFRSTRAAIAGLYPQPLVEPVPAHLVHLVLGAKEGVVAMPLRAPTGSRPWIERVQEWISQSFVPGWPVAIACASAMLVGFGAARLLDSSSGNPTRSHPLLAYDTGKLIAQGPLMQLLELSPAVAKLLRGQRLMRRR